LAARLRTTDRSARSPAVGLLYWRFVCELFMLAFRGYEHSAKCDLMRIAAGQAPPATEPDENHPAF
jgi:hypothetical protein